MLFTAFLNAVTAAIIKFDGIVTGSGIVGLAWFRQPSSRYHETHCIFTVNLWVCRPTHSYYQLALWVFTALCLSSMLDLTMVYQANEESHAQGGATGKEVKQQAGFGPNTEV